MWSNQNCLADRPIWSFQGTSINICSGLLIELRGNPSFESETPTSLKQKIRYIHFDFQYGMDALFFGRLDYQDKARRLQTKEMEMVWMGSDNLGSSESS